ncbi:hypothetical protein [Ferribacterium limneticum]|nr:hypothetical protein [Ferribacterium limneticum]
MIIKQKEAKKNRGPCRFSGALVISFQMASAAVRRLDSPAYRLLG